MSDTPVGRRESDPRIEHIETSLEQISQRLERHERGANARTQSIDELKTSIAQVDKKLVVLDDIQKQVSDHHELLYGDGDGKAGILIKIDRLIRLGEVVTKIAWLIFGVLTTGFISALIAHLVNPRLP